MLCHPCSNSVCRTVQRCLEVWFESNFKNRFLSWKPWKKLRTRKWGQNEEGINIGKAGLRLIHNSFCLFLAFFQHTGRSSSHRCFTHSTHTALNTIPFPKEVEQARKRYRDTRECDHGGKDNFSAKNKTCFSEHWVVPVQAPDCVFLRSPRTAFSYAARRRDAQDIVAQPVMDSIHSTTTKFWLDTVPSLSVQGILAERCGQFGGPVSLSKWPEVYAHVDGNAEIENCDPKVKKARQQTSAVASVRRLIERHSQCCGQGARSDQKVRISDFFLIDSKAE